MKNIFCFRKNVAQRELRATLLRARATIVSGDQVDDIIFVQLPRFDDWCFFSAAAKCNTKRPRAPKIKVIAQTSQVIQVFYVLCDIKKTQRIWRIKGQNFEFMVLRMLTINKPKSWSLKHAKAMLLYRTVSGEVDLVVTSVWFYQSLLPSLINRNISAKLGRIWTTEYCTWDHPCVSLQALHSVQLWRNRFRSMTFHDQVSGLTVSSDDFTAPKALFWSPVLLVWCSVAVCWCDVMVWWCGVALAGYVAWVPKTTHKDLIRSTKMRSEAGTVSRKWNHHTLEWKLKIKHNMFGSKHLQAPMWLSDVFSTCRLKAEAKKSKKKQTVSLTIRPTGQASADTSVLSLNR